mgnify:CR=1 FL=1
MIGHSDFMYSSMRELVLWHCQMAWTSVRENSSAISRNTTPSMVTCEVKTGRIPIPTRAEARMSSGDMLERLTMSVIHIVYAVCYDVGKENDHDFEALSRTADTRDQPAPA